MGDGGEVVSTRNYRLIFFDRWKLHRIRISVSINNVLLDLGHAQIAALAFSCLHSVRVDRLGRPDSPQHLRHFLPSPPFSVAVLSVVCGPFQRD